MLETIRDSLRMVGFQTTVFRSFSADVGFLVPDLRAGRIEFLFPARMPLRLVDIECASASQSRFDLLFAAWLDLELCRGSEEFEIFRPPLANRPT